MERGIHLLHHEGIVQHQQGLVQGVDNALRVDGGGSVGA
jgi:hypothetical protein